MTSITDTRLKINLGQALVFLVVVGSITKLKKQDACSICLVKSLGLVHK